MACRVGDGSLPLDDEEGSRNARVCVASAKIRISLTFAANIINDVSAPTWWEMEYCNGAAQRRWWRTCLFCQSLPVETINYGVPLPFGSSSTKVLILIRARRLLRYSLYIFPSFLGFVRGVRSSAVVPLYTSQLTTVRFRLVAQRKIRISFLGKPKLPHFFSISLGIIEEEISGSRY